MSDKLGGSLLLVDSLSWMGVYFTGIPSNNCNIIRHAMNEAVSSCTGPLSYNPSALIYSYIELVYYGDILVK